MSKQIEAPTQRFYSPVAKDSYYPLSESRETPDLSKNNPHINALVKHCVQGIEKHKIGAFHNGETSHPLSHKTTKDGFTKSATEVISASCADLFDQKGNIPEDNHQQWQNITRIAPRLIELFTDESNHIYSINREQTVNLLRIAVEAARNPKIIEEARINIGIGGSDDTFSTSRLPAYIVPVTSLIRNIKNFYDAHTAITLQEEAMKRHLSNNEKQDIEESVKKNGLHIPEDMTEEALEQHKKRNAIPMKMPEGHLFSGAVVAKVINHIMDPEKIDERDKENLRIIRNYINTEHADVADNIKVTSGLPWPESAKNGERTISPYTRVTVDYLANLLETAETPEITYAVDNLKKRGERRGGEAGKAGAMIYAASHPLLFGDRLNLPYAKIIDGVNKPPSVLFSIGGKTEKQFDIARSYVSQNASAAGLRNYLKEQQDNSTDPNAQAKLHHMEKVIGRWERITDAYRKKAYQNRNEHQAKNTPLISRSDGPQLGTVQLLTKVGENATYYAIEHGSAVVPDENGQVKKVEFPIDLPYGTDVNKQIKTLSETLEKIKTASSQDKDLRKVNMLAIEKIRSVIYDLTVLQGGKITLD